MFGSLCPLSVIRYHLRAFLLDLYGSLFFGHIRAFLLGFICCYLSRECLSPASRVSSSWSVSSISPGGIVGDGDLIGEATWDALSSSVSCFEPFLVTLFVFCDRATVSFFVLSSGLSILGNGLVVLSIRSLVILRVCVARLVKVYGSDKLLK